MKALVVANWKMNPPTWREAKQLFQATKKAADKYSRSSVVVAPPSIFLRDLSMNYKGRRISFAAQDVHSAPGGAHTGEVSASQVKDAKAQYVIVGHAERRAAGDTDAEVGKKVAAALEAGLSPILCVGEHERGKNGEYFDLVRKQISTGLAEMPPGTIARLVIAYEPVWAIGAAQPMQPRDMHEMAIFIRKCVMEKHGQAALKVKVLYGGSIDETNAGDMMRYGDVAGLLVGRASTRPEQFTALLSALNSL